MSKAIWVIIFLTIMAAIVVLVVGVYYLNFRYSPSPLPKDLPSTPAGAEPAKTTVTDGQIAHLEAQLEDSNPDTRFIAICSLNTLAEDDPQRLGPILVKALANDDTNVRFFAASRLGDLKYSPAARLLVDLLDDTDKNVVAAAELALEKLDEDSLQAVMQVLAENRLRNIDSALAVAGRIPGEFFGQGQEGRAAALKFWTTYSRKAREKNN